MRELAHPDQAGPRPSRRRRRNGRARGTAGPRPTAGSGTGPNSGCSVTVRAASASARPVASVMFSPEAPGVPASAPGIGRTPPGPAVPGITGGGVPPGVTGGAPGGGSGDRRRLRRAPAWPGLARPPTAWPRPRAGAAGRLGRSRVRARARRAAGPRRGSLARPIGPGPIPSTTIRPRLVPVHPWVSPVNRSHPCARGPAARAGSIRGRAGRRGGPSPIRSILSLTNRQAGDHVRHWRRGHWSIGGGCGGFVTSVSRFGLSGHLMRGVADRRRRITNDAMTDDKGLMSRTIGGGGRSRWRPWSPARPWRPPPAVPSARIDRSPRITCSLPSIGTTVRAAGRGRDLAIGDLDPLAVADRGSRSPTTPVCDLDPLGVAVLVRPAEGLLADVDQRRHAAAPARRAAR